MHDTVIDPRIRQRYTAMKGGEFAFVDVDPTRTAHLIVDMQNGFVQEGATLEVPMARTIVDDINAVSRAVRAGGGLNCFFQFTTSTEDSWPVYFRQFQNPDFARDEVSAFRSGGPEHRLFDGLEVGQGDLVLEKTRFSAFTAGSSAAAAVLAERDIDTVIISGTLTDCCCDATARDAQQLGFRVIFLEDATAALSDAEHTASITVLAAWFADIRTSSDVIELLRTPNLRA